MGGSAKPKKAVIARKKKRVESFSIYIYRVLKQVHPETGISKRSMSIMNSFIYDIFEKIAPNLPSSSDSARNTLSHPEKSRPPSDSSSQESLPSMPSQREPRLSPSTPQTSDQFITLCLKHHINHKQNRLLI